MTMVTHRVGMTMVTRRAAVILIGVTRRVEADVVTVVDIILILVKEVINPIRGVINQGNMHIGILVLNIKKCINLLKIEKELVLKNLGNKR